MSLISLALLGASILSAPLDPVETHVEATLAKMTLKEKITLIGGDRSMFIRPNLRVGIPEIKMSDGPVGVRTWGPSTAYPAGIVLAAAFDPSLSQRFGESIGRDAKARGVHIWLAPGVNLARVPQNGRNFEYQGEDPYLTSRGAVAVIKGVQSQGVVATVKHFAANDHENDRNMDSSEVDERTLREIYLRPFEAAVKEGHVGAVMSGYNKLNGTYASEHQWLVQGVLKGDWGFDGIYMSDWGAAHSSRGTYLHGLDLEMPSPDFMNEKSLLQELDKGQLDPKPLDDKVRRILRIIYRFGFDKKPQLDPTIPKDDPASDRVALAIAREGTVLLKNDGILPLRRDRVRNVLVLGPDVVPANISGGGSSYTDPFHKISIPDAIKKIAGSGVEVNFRPVIGKINEAFAFTGYEGGLKGEYFANKTLSGTPTLVRKDAGIDFNWHVAPGKGLAQTDFSVRWTGSFRAKSDGAYVFAARTDDGVRVYVDGKLMLDRWIDRGAATDTFQLNLKKGQSYALKVEYYQGMGDAIAQFGLMPVEELLSNTLPTDLVRSADAVVVSVGFNSDTESEGQDRPFEIPMEQRLMIERVTKLSKRCIVVNHSGAAIGTTPWIDGTAAFIQAGYPGQNGNQALAEILFGDVNPSGKSPVTFPKALLGTYYATAYPPVKGKMFYREGLFMGYRWFDKNNVAPRFPFGFGLSYTKFRFGGLKLHPIVNGLEVEATVTNTGSVKGDEVVQLYAGYAQSSVPRAVRELKGFQRVSLAPGQSKTVHLALDRNAVAFYDVAKHGWVVEAGDVTVWVGDSSRDLPLKGIWSLR